MNDTLLLHERTARLACDAIPLRPFSDIIEECELQRCGDMALVKTALVRTIGFREIMLTSPTSDANELRMMIKLIAPMPRYIVDYVQGIRTDNENGRFVVTLVRKMTEQERGAVIEQFRASRNAIGEFPIGFESTDSRETKKIYAGTAV